MSSVEELAAGQTLTWTREVTDDDIAEFGELTGDLGRHHLQRDAKGRLMAHGLLTASMPTKLGGDLHYMARTMHFEFLRPAYGGDTLTCVGKVLSVLRKPTRIKVEFAFEVRNQEGELLMTGTSSGNIFLAS